MTTGLDGVNAPQTPTERPIPAQGETPDQKPVSIGRWLAIARVVAVIPLLLALAAAAVLAVDTRTAKALDSEEEAFLSIINDYRAANGLGTLALDPQLNAVARWMADDLAANDYFSHTDSLGRDPFQRMDEMGYDYNTWRGENLVAGTAGAQASFDMWAGSLGHNANMLGEHYTVIGIARSYNADSTFGWYWATEFGGHSAPPPAPDPTPGPTPPPAPVVDAPEQQASPPPAPTFTAPPPTPVATPDPTPEETATPRSTPEATVTNTPAPTPTQEIGPAQASTSSWWRSLQRVGDAWGAPDRGGSFVSAIRSVALALAPTNR